MRARGPSGRAAAWQSRRSEDRSLHEAVSNETLVLDAYDLEALLGAIRADSLPELERRSARLRALLGPQADKLEPHVAALRARLTDLARARHLAATDALTSLANRRAFTEALRRELARANRSGAALAVVMLDIDDFKRINDTYGHARGDEILRLFARCATAATRKGDLLGRVGGDEFLLLLPETDHARAVAIAERIRADVAAAAVSRSMTAGLSVGVATSNPGSSAQSVIAEADRAMYQDKAARRAGRETSTASEVPSALPVH